MSALIFQKTERNENSTLNSSGNPQGLLALAAFVIGLLPCLLHNFNFCESRIMLATDGKHFLTTVTLLVEFLKQHLGTADAGSFLVQSQLAGHIILDGPLMSLIYAPVFLLLGHVPVPRDWIVLALGQSVFHALSTAILSLLVYRLTRSRLFAVFAALVYGLYPSAVLQSGHFMSELPVTTILLGLLYAVTARVRPFLSFLLAGALVSVIVVSKPALIPCATLVLLLGILGKRTEGKGQNIVFGPLQISRKALSGTICGIMLVLTPWSVFSYAATGNILPTAQRQPLYNVASGWNTEAAGWAYNPHAPMTDLFTEADGPLGTAMGIWMSRPQESALLALSKLSRLFSCPWNDFKGRALGIDENAQILLHRLILAIAAFGASAFVLSRRRYLNVEQRNLLQISLVLIASHLAYLMVECQPRYAFTAVPFAVLLAIYGIWQVSSLSFQDAYRRLLIVASVGSALAISAVLIHAENISNLFNPRVLIERTNIINTRDRVEKVIDFTGVKTPERIKSVFLLVDGDKELEKASVQLNGIDLRKKLLSTMHFDAAHYALYDQLREFGPAMRISVDDFRQWRAIPVDPSLINWQSKNRVLITGLAKTATIYSDRRESRYSLSPDYCNYGILAAAPVAAGAESRYTDPVTTAAVKQESFAISKGEPRAALKNSLRVKLLLVLDEGMQNSAIQNGASQASSSDKPAVCKINVSRKVFDPMLWDSGSTDRLRINKVVLYAARTVAAELPLPDMKSSTHIKLRITGEFKALKNPGEVGLGCAVKGINGGVQILGKTPRALQAKADWSKFEIQDLVPQSSVGGKISHVHLALYPCPWMEGQYGVSRHATDALFRNVYIEAEAVDLPSISGRRIIY